ncbi:MAG: glutamine--fructose-6-phosphate transaminase (isomerizing), partial [Thermoprotei archaeon]
MICSMCGIVGYIGDGNAAKIGLSGLKRLEYRGYDSAGIAMATQGKIDVRKGAGRIDRIDSKLGISFMDGHLAILHTRWSTHGEPTKANAHPHTDCKGNIAIVHNGIIENYSSLKHLLIKEGHEIRSKTDSEIIAHMIEKFYDGDLESAVMKALNSVEGAYGLAVIHKDEDKIIAAKKGSPLVIGVGENEMMVASDVAAVMERTKKVIYLDDNEIAVVTKDDVRIKNMRNEEVNKEIKEIKWDLEQIEKKGFKHFMLKEIFEQPESLDNTLRGRLKDEIKLSIDIDIKKIGRVIITACGTSWHAGLVGRWLIEKLAGIPVEVDYASE